MHQLYSNIFKYIQVYTYPVHSRRMLIVFTNPLSEQTGAPLSSTSYRVNQQTMGCNHHSNLSSLNRHCNRSQMLACTCGFYCRGNCSWCALLISGSISNGSRKDTPKSIGYHHTGHLAHYIPLLQRIQVDMSWLIASWSFDCNPHTNSTNPTSI